MVASYHSGNAVWIAVMLYCLGIDKIKTVHTCSVWMPFFPEQLWTMLGWSHRCGTHDLKGQLYTRKPKADGEGDNHMFSAMTSSWLRSYKAEMCSPSSWPRDWLLQRCWLMGSTHGSGMLRLCSHCPWRPCRHALLIARSVSRVQTTNLQGQGSHTSAT